MLHTIINFSIRNKLLIGLAVLIFTAYGIYEVTQLPIDAVPDITNNQVQVITVAPALGATDIERLITVPIEQALANIPEVIEQRSFSRFGLSIVTLVFNDKTDIYWVRQQSTERLQGIMQTLPIQYGIPFIAPLTTGLGEIFQYTVRAQNGYESRYSPMDLRTIQDWTIRKQLLQTPGIADVSSFGGHIKQFEIAIDPNKLFANRLTLEDVYDAVVRNNENTGGAYIEKGPNVLFIRTEGLISDSMDAGWIVIKHMQNGTPVLLKDIAKIQSGHATRYGALTLNGTTEVSGAVVMMLKGENSNQVIKNVKLKIAEIQQQLPEGILIEPFLDRTKMVNRAITTVSINLVEGALIVVFVLVLFLGSLRAGLVVAFVIPLSMLFAVICMNRFGVSGNLMSLGALDFGLIIDGAVIIVEAWLHYMYSQKQKAVSQTFIDTEVGTITTRMMKSALFGQLIILMVYLPIFTLQGIEGKMFIPMAQTVAFALTGAFICSITFVPWASSILLKPSVLFQNTFSLAIFNRATLIYRRALRYTIRKPKHIFLMIGTLVLLAFLLLSNLGGEFIPTLPEGDFAVETRVWPGSGLHTAVELSSKASRLLISRFPEIEKIVTKTGSSEIPIDPMPMDASDMIIVLKDRNTWINATTYKDLEQAMLKCLEEIPGATFSFQYPVAMRFNELISGARQDVVCKIYGPHLDTLSSLAQRFGRLCNSMPGISGLYIEQNAGLPQITIQYNRSRIAQYGLSVTQLNTIVNTALAGKSCGYLYDNDKRIDVVLRFAGEQRNQIEDVRRILIKTPFGNQIPLQEVADINTVNGYSQIQRDKGQRRVMVGFNIRQGDVEGAVKRLQSTIEAKLKLPQGYRISYGGAFENLKTAKARLAIAVPIALILILLVLYLAFRSIALSLIIFTAVPLSAVGGIIALYLRQIPFSISAGIGFIALFGVAVLNGIVLVAAYQTKTPYKGKALLRHILYASQTRLRPVLLTASVATLGFLPMAFSTGEGAEVQRPLATVVIGGLLMSTALTLLLLPMLYQLVLKVSFRFKHVKLFLIMGLLLSNILNAQKPISYHMVLDAAYKNSPDQKQNMLQYQFNLEQAAAFRQPTGLQITSEYGQFNSIYTDTRIGIEHNISFLIKNRFKAAEFKQQQVLYSVLNQQSNNSLQLQCSQLFADWIYLYQKQKLLLETDSILQILTAQSQLKLKTGDIEPLDLKLIVQQKAQSEMACYENTQALNQTQYKMLYHLKSPSDFSTSYIPACDFKTDTSLQLNIEALLIHPDLLALKQQANILNAQRNTLKAEFIPDVTLGYNAMSMQGNGADNIKYNNTMQFNWMQLRVVIPLNAKRLQHQLRAQTLSMQLFEFKATTQQQILQAQLQMALSAYMQSREAIRFYILQGLNNAQLIQQLALIKYTSGSIDFSQWQILHSQSVNVRMSYLEQLRKLYIHIGTLYYLLKF